jgi:Exopolysaccharide biosynthesis protein related to N-acetylglucosamine-1-phosphodiester alpha-N-acetylglucosaminidase
MNIAIRWSARDRNQTVKQSIVTALLAISSLAFAAGFRAQGQTAQSTPAPKSEFIAPGIEHLQITRGYKSDKEITGPWFINMLRIDLRKARLRMVHAMDEAVGLETVSSLATRYGALAAINSGYFRTTGTYRGDSVGTQVLNGQILSESNNGRAAVGLVEGSRAQQIVFGHVVFTGELIAGAKAKHLINGLNRPRADDELIIFTPEFHRTTLTNPDGLEVIVRRGRVTEIRELQGSSTIPTDGFVISASGSAREWVRQNSGKRTSVRLSLKMSPLETDQKDEWQKATSIIGGGPQLIKDSRVEITNAAEKILPAFVSDLHPRTAIAKLKSGELLLVTVDGRQTASIGMSLTMLADLLIEFGATDAINLDGGGSTTMVIRNRLVNKPSDTTGERPVSDAILIYPR